VFLSQYCMDCPSVLIS